MTEQTPAPPANATEARAALNLKMADPDWSARFLRGDVAAVQEFGDLTGRVATGGDDVVANVMNGTVPPTVDHFAQPKDIREMSVAVELFRDVGINDEITADFLRGRKVTAEEYKATVNLKRALMNDPVFTKAFLAGEQEAVKKMRTADSIIVNGVKEAAA